MQEYLDRQELADEICGGGGICNDYVTCLAVIENGTHLPYRIHYTSRCGERKVLNKREPEVIGNDDEWFFEFYNDVQIEWLDDSQQQAAP